MLNILCINKEGNVILIDDEAHGYTTYKLESIEEFDDFEIGYGDKDLLGFIEDDCGDREEYIVLFDCVGGLENNVDISIPDLFKMINNGQIEDADVHIALLKYMSLYGAN